MKKKRKNRLIENSGLYCAKVVTSFLILLLFTLSTFAQEEVAKDEPVEQLKSRTSLTITQEDQDQITIEALVRAKIEKRWTGLSNLEVQYFSELDSLKKSLGKAITDENGIATLSIKAPDLYRDTAETYFISAIFKGNELYKKSDDDTEIIAASISLETLDNDSVRYVDVVVQSRGEGVKDADLILYAKTLFYPLKIGEATTNSKGKAKIEFPMDLPGDQEGNIAFFIFGEDLNDYGNLKFEQTMPWGHPHAPPQKSAKPRMLWSPNPPLWMLLSFFIIMAATWGTYLVIVYNISKIKHA